MLGLCDGTRTLTEVAEASGSPDDARALIEALAGERVVVDKTESWRRFHELSSAHWGLYRPLGDEEALELARQAWRPTGEPLRREALRPREAAVIRIASRRRSAYAGEQPREVSYEELSTLLCAMYGATGERRPVPSGGALYPLVIHVVVRRALGPLEPGLWWYDPSLGALDLLDAGAVDLTELFLPHASTNPALARGHPIVFLSADMERPTRKYAGRGYRLALMEVGAAMQNAYLVAAELDVPIRAVQGFDEYGAADRLRLSDDSVALLSLLLGS